MPNHSNFPPLSSQLSQIHPKSMRDGGLTKKLFRGALFQVIILQMFANGVPHAHVTLMDCTLVLIPEQLLLCT